MHEGLGVENTIFFLSKKKIMIHYNQLDVSTLSRLLLSFSSQSSSPRLLSPPPRSPTSSPSPRSPPCQAAAAAGAECRRGRLPASGSGKGGRAAAASRARTTTSPG